MSNLNQELKEKIIAQLNLEDVKPENIDDNAPLFGDGLGLDSIDALELIVLMDKSYGLKITNPEAGKEIFFSINSMAKYITEHKK